MHCGRYHTWHMAHGHGHGHGVMDMDMNGKGGSAARAATTSGFIHRRICTSTLERARGRSREEGRRHAQCGGVSLHIPQLVY
eukprot:1401065-Prymnesium_polylepis.1